MGVYLTDFAPSKLSGISYDAAGMKKIYAPCNHDLDNIMASSMDNHETYSGAYMPGTQ